MMNRRPIVQKFSFCFFFLSFFFCQTLVVAQDARALFQSNCASCHALNKDLTGPALAGFQNRGPWADKKEFRAWVKNPVAYMAKDPYTQGLKQQYGSIMQAFPNLADA